MLCKKVFQPCHQMPYLPIILKSSFLERFSLENCSFILLGCTSLCPLNLMADTFAVAHCHLPYQHCNLFFFGIGGRFCQKVKFKINKNGDFGGFQLQKMKKKKKRTEKTAKFLYLVSIVELEI